MSFLDGDEEVLRLLGAPTVSDAFASVGEAGFRAAELEVLPTLLGGPSGVVALGGGTPCIPGAEQVLLDACRRGAMVIWLDADDATLVDRLRRGGDRPRLSRRELPEEIRWLRGERQRTYRRLAEIRLDTSVYRIDGAIRAIRGWLLDRASDLTPPA